jgi:hypothetical protein
MMEYEFTLNFRLADHDADLDKLVERLGVAGCDDALVGIGQVGRLGLDFTRRADSAGEAILSALADVKKAVPTATLVEISPDFVGLTDVADLMGVSRQNMRKFMVSHAGSFPAPIHEGSSSLWHLALVLRFLEERGQYRLDPSLVDVAVTAMRLNITKETSLIDGQVEEKMYPLLA